MDLLIQYGVSLTPCLQQSPVQAADGPAHSVWSQPNTDPVGCRSAPGKNSGYAAWKLELCSSSAHNGPTTRITALAGPLQCLTKGLADLNQNGPSKILTLANGEVRTKHQRTPRRQPKQCDNWIVYPCAVTTPDLSSVQTRHKHCGARLATEKQANQCQQSHWMELWLKEQVSEIPWDPLLQNADLQKQVETTALKCKKGPPVLKVVAANGIERHLFLLYQSVVLSVTDY